eukprot:TRINITY_DN13956_c0_g2_i1.p1 TRINITY_DN13956_c0_g2~~TRINITY_DN13956_c0_g2_i1.p1  ORF type:complete len:698 (+),score=209.52 TRINITY_DN13956_c0_g2_i1:97-2094(+)
MDFFPRGFFFPEPWKDCVFESQVLVWNGSENETFHFEVTSCDSSLYELRLEHTSSSDVTLQPGDSLTLTLRCAKVDSSAWDAFVTLKWWPTSSSISPPKSTSPSSTPTSTSPRTPFSLFRFARKAGEMQIPCLVYLIEPPYFMRCLRETIVEPSPQTLCRVLLPPEDDVRLELLKFKSSGVQHVEAVSSAEMWRRLVWMDGMDEQGGDGSVSDVRSNESERAGVYFRVPHDDKWYEMHEFFLLLHKGGNRVIPLQRVKEFVGLLWDLHDDFVVGDGVASAVLRGRVVSKDAFRCPLCLAQMPRAKKVVSSSKSTVFVLRCGFCRWTSELRGETQWEAFQHIADELRNREKTARDDMSFLLESIRNGLRGKNEAQTDVDEDGDKNDKDEDGVRRRWEMKHQTFSKRLMQCSWETPSLLLDPSSRLRQFPSCPTTAGGNEDEDGDGDGDGDGEDVDAPSRVLPLPVPMKAFIQAHDPVANSCVLKPAIHGTGADREIIFNFDHFLKYRFPFFAVGNGMHSPFEIDRMTIVPVRVFLAGAVITLNLTLSVLSPLAQGDMDESLEEKETEREARWASIEIPVEEPWMFTLFDDLQDGGTSATDKAKVDRMVSSSSSSSAIRMHSESSAEIFIPIVPKTHGKIRILLHCVAESSKSSPVELDVGIQLGKV